MILKVIILLITVFSNSVNAGVEIVAGFESSKEAAEIACNAYLRSIHPD